MKSKALRARRGRAGSAVSLTAALAAMSAFAQEREATLPGRYFHAIHEEIKGLHERIPEGSVDKLQAVEEASGVHSFPSALLASAVLYAKPADSNPAFGDPAMLSLAKRLGDLLAGASRSGDFDSRSDSHRDLYMWIEAYRLIETELGPDRRKAWRGELWPRLARLHEQMMHRADVPAYTGFLGTSTNHFALWASTVYLGGKTLGETEWVENAGRVMHRLAVEEQSPDGCWGEHGYRFPATGYNYLTVCGVALYWEHSGDPAALEALRRATTFHMHFTYPDGFPVETIDSRNRSWWETEWGMFGFSNFPDGRGYAEFLTSAILARGRHALRRATLGRFAQNALYYREGPTAPIPQDMAESHHRMEMEPAGIRRVKPWVVCLSGLISPPLPTARFQLDRQGHVSVFHDDLGLIITGANSKNQPELATFRERFGDEMNHLPLNSRLRMADDQDRLALLYNTFWSELHVPKPTDDRLEMRFHVMPRGSRDAEGFLSLQLRLRSGETLETGAGESIVLDQTRIDLGPEQIGGWIRHRGWVLRVPDNAQIAWPVFPFNPYRRGPEAHLAHAVGTVAVPLRVHRIAEDVWYGEPYGEDAYDIEFVLEVPADR